MGEIECAIMNRLYSRVHEAERLTEESDSLTKGPRFADVEDYAELGSIADEVGKRYLHISNLEADIRSMVTEILSEDKISDEQLDALMELHSLRNRVNNVLGTLFAVAARIMKKDGELIEEARAEVASLAPYREAFYDMAPPPIGGGPGDEEE